MHSIARVSRCSVYQKLSAMVIFAFPSTVYIFYCGASLSVYIVNQNYGTALIFMGNHIGVALMAFEFTSYMLFMTAA